MRKLINSEYILVLLSSVFLTCVCCSMSSIKKDIVIMPPTNKNLKINIPDNTHVKDLISRGISSQFAVNSETYFAATPSVPSSPFKKIISSQDSGKTWQFLGINDNNLERIIQENPVNIFFIDKLHGWISSNENTWETRDGGEAWKKIFDNKITNIFFYDLNNGWMSLSNNKKYKTQDGGKNWLLCDVNKTKTRVEGGAFFVSSQLGWSFTTKYIHGAEVTGIAKTSDGGCQWDEIWKGWNNPDIHFGDIFFINDEIGWFSTIDNNALFQTNNGGKTWKKIEIPNENNQIETFFFKNMLDGWILFASDPEKPIFYRTSDGGNSWQAASKEELYQSYLSEINFPRVSHGLREAIVIQNSSK